MSAEFTPHASLTFTRRFQHPCCNKTTDCSRNVKCSGVTPLKAPMRNRLFHFCKHQRPSPAQHLLPVKSQRIMLPVSSSWGGISFMCRNTPSSELCDGYKPFLTRLVWRENTEDACEDKAVMCCLGDFFFFWRVLSI